MYRISALVVVALTLVLSGCQRTPPVPAGPETLTSTVTEGWFGQSASLRLEAVVFSDATLLIEAPIAADGSFNVTLPDQQGVADALTPVDAEALCALSGPNPAGSLDVTPSPLNVLYAEAKVYASAAADAELLGVLGYQADTAAGLTSVIRIYAASAGTVEGSCGDGALTFDLELQAGWNEVLYTEGGSGITLTTGELPSGLRWRYYALSGEPGPPVDPPGSPVEPPEPTPTTPTSKEISGTAQGWPGGEATVRAESIDPDASRSTDVAEGTVSDDGSFGLTLPVDETALTEAFFTADQKLFCPGPGVSTVEITPGPFETVFVGPDFLVYDSADGSEVIGSISLNYSIQQDSFTYVYASSDVRVKGECVTTYTEGSSTISFDLDFKAGWNAIFSADSSSEDGYALSVSTGPFPTDSRWVYTAEVPVPSPEPLPPCELDDLECTLPDTPVRPFSGWR